MHKHTNIIKLLKFDMDKGKNFMWIKKWVSGTKIHTSVFAINEDLDEVRAVGGRDPRGSVDTFIV